MNTESRVSPARRLAGNLMLAGALIGLVCVGWALHVPGPVDPGPIAVVAEPRAEEIDKTLEVGVNRITFDWSEDGLDPASLELICLASPGEVELLGMELERDSGELTWRVFSDAPGEARFRVAYVAFE